MIGVSNRDAKMKAVRPLKRAIRILIFAGAAELLESILVARRAHCRTPGHGSGDPARDATLHNFVAGPGTVGVVAD